MVYCTVQDVADELRTSSFTPTTTPSDETIVRWIAQATDEIDNRTGTVWEPRKATSVKLDYDGTGVVFTPHKPIISIDALKVQEYDLGYSTQSTTTLTEGRNEDFIVYYDEGEIHFINSDTYPSAGKQRIELDYTYGYENVPEVVRKLCVWIVSKRVIMSLLNSQTNEEGGSVTVGNISISDPSIFSINYIKFLNDQIESTIQDLNQAHSIRYQRYY